jgi:hypothetical protein
VFGGDPLLKLLQQVMAAALCGVELNFSCWGAVVDDVQEVVALVQGRSVGELFAIVAANKPEFLRPGGFRQWCFHRLRGDEPPADITPAETEARELASEAAALELRGEMAESLSKLKRAFRLCPELEFEL